MTVNAIKGDTKAVECIILFGKVIHNKKHVHFSANFY